MPGVVEVPDWRTHAQRGVKNPRFTEPRSVRTARGGHTAPVRCMSWSCDGKVLATGGDDKNVKLWDFKANSANPFTVQSLSSSDSLLPTFSTTDTSSSFSTFTPSTSTTSTSSIRFLAFSPRQADILAVGTHSDSWSAGNDGPEGVEVVQEMGSREWRWGKGEESGKKVDEKRPRVTIWNTRKRQPISTILLNHNPVSVTFHPSSYQLIIVCMGDRSSDYAITVWQQHASLEDDLITADWPTAIAREHHELLPNTSSSAYVPGLQTPHEGVSRSGAEKAKRKRDLETKQARSLKADEEGAEGWTVREDAKLVLREQTESRERGWKASISELNGLTFLPNGSRFYTGNHDGTVHTWQFNLLPIQSTPQADASTSSQANFVDVAQPNTQDIAAPNGAETVEKQKGDEDVDMDASAVVEAEAQEDGTPDEDVKMADGVEVVAEDKAAEAEPEKVEVQYEKGIRWLSGRNISQGCVNCMVIDPRRRFIATGGSDGLVTLDELKEWIPVQVFDSYTEEARHVQFSWDGEYLAAAGDDNSIDIMSPSIGQTLHKLKTDGHVRALTWCPARQCLSWATDARSANGDWNFIVI